MRCERRDKRDVGGGLSLDRDVAGSLYLDEVSAMDPLGALDSRRIHFDVCDSVFLICYTVFSENRENKLQEFSIVTQQLQAVSKIQFFVFSQFNALNRYCMRFHIDNTENYFQKCYRTQPPFLQPPFLKW
ncbi:hypothetical protein M0R45_025810 [Rubus argutus]|uniref:Uncharacterized protein n=1 Tax=Rubus argutus TaxID=59490 RepID=A0AAW1WVU4_RUBAR